MNHLKAFDDTDVVVPLEPVVLPAVKPHGRLYPTQGTALAQCPTNLDLSSYEGKQLAIAAGNPSDFQMDEGGQICIMATHYLIFPDVSEDPETGELKEFARTVLFDASGQIYRTTSAHAPHRIAAVLDLYDASEWTRGIPFVIRERRSKKTGRVYHDIRVGPRPQ